MRQRGSPQTRPFQQTAHSARHDSGRHQVHPPKGHQLRGATIQIAWSAAPPAPCRAQACSPGVGAASQDTAAETRLLPTKTSAPAGQSLAPRRSDRCPGWPKHRHPPEGRSPLKSPSIPGVPSTACSGRLAQAGGVFRRLHHCSTTSGLPYQRGPKAPPWATPSSTIAVDPARRAPLTGTRPSPRSLGLPLLLR